MMSAQWARKFKKVQAKKLMNSNKTKREIAFLVILKTFSPCISKIDFWPFLKSQKVDFGQKKIFREIDLFDITSFFGLDFLNFLAHCVNV